MFPPPAASSNTFWDLSDDIGPDRSSCSSDTGGVLIRSTRALLSDRGREAGPGPESVQITVQKLRDHPVQQQQRPKSRQKPNRAEPPLWAPEHSDPGRRSDRRTLRKPEPTKENRAPTERQPPAVESSPERKLCAGARGQQPPGHELLTSRFTTGGRGVVLAALKQRSHSAPHRREVKVQLLNPEPHQTSSQASGLSTSAQDAVGMEGVEMEAKDTTTTAAAAAAAAVAAAAPLIKAQSDMEARVSQLADGVQKLLQADREGGDRGQCLSQQMLHHLETLHSQQLQLQSQLLESAFKIVTGHTSVTPTTDPDPAASCQASHLQVTHLDTAANVLGNQQQISSAAKAAATTMETNPVAMETTHCDRWPEQTRDDQHHCGPPSVSTATRSAAGSHLQSSANHSQAAARRAKEMLREMGRLKSEMKMLLMPEDSLKTTRSGPDHHQSQQSLRQSPQSPSQQIQSQPRPFRSLESKSHQSMSQTQHSKYQQTEPQLSKSQQTQCQSQQVQSHQIPLQQIHSPQNQTSQTQRSQSILVQKPVVPSMLEEASQVLRRTQRQRKVLEENLEALLRVKTGEVLHCQLEALAANRDWTEEVRIKKTVDAWISTLTKDIQAEMSSKDAVHCRAADDASKHSAIRDTTVTSQKSTTGRGKPLSMLRGIGSKTVTARGSRGQTTGQKAPLRAEPGRVPGGLINREQVEEDGESYLTRLYGRAPYEGLRRTLKKSPYLRFSSPVSPLGRKPRPRLVESVRGVKVKSCKTQTCLAPTLSLSPGRPQHHDIISSSHADLSVTPADSHSVPMAIPLGRPRVDSSSRCLVEHQQDVTSLPTPPPTCPVVAVDDGASELPSQRVEQPDAGEVLPPPLPPADIIERKSEEEEDKEDEENIFPGTDFLCVTDVIQEEVSVVGEDVVEVDGGPSPPPVLYQGPVFPPQLHSVLPAQDQASHLNINLRRDTLENRLVEWVEQQLMSRMISEMYQPPHPDPVQNDSTDQSEAEEQSVTSDIVEAAGGGGLQLFVDSNMSVDSALIRQLVSEVLTEHVALMLGQRDSGEARSEPGLEPPKPRPSEHPEEKLVPLVPTPVPTPPASPTSPNRESQPVTTPPPSEPASLLDEESPQPITAAERVATPTSSPEPIQSAGSPPDAHQAPPPLAWEDTELPLDEERPEDVDTHPRPLVMSVAEEEPLVATPLPPPPPSVPPAPSPSSPPPDPRPVSPSSSSEDSSTSSTSSSSSSSSAVTAGTDAALKHISEGELLISVNQLAAMTEEDAVCSFSSSLHELQEMDFDPPSEGQVRGHNLLLTLLTKMEQGVTHTQRGERPQPEGAWGRDQEEEEVSLGEVRDDLTTKPHRTTNPYNKSTTAPSAQRSSPGQISQCADVSEVTFEATNQDSVTMGDLVMEPVGTLTSDLQTELSLSPPPPPHLEDTAGQVFLVTPYDRITAEQQHGGTRRMDVHLPPIRPEGEDMMEESAESSTDDIF